PWARGGFLGVDAFFVLSGYLITTLLLAEWDRRGAVDLRAFWGRRARRLLPALGLLMLGIAVYAAAFTPADIAGSLRLDALATAGTATDAAGGAGWAGRAGRAAWRRRGPARWGDGAGRPVWGLAGWLGAALTLGAWTTVDGRSPVLYRGGFGVVALSAAA